MPKPYSGFLSKDPRFSRNIGQAGLLPKKTSKSHPFASFVRRYMGNCSSKSLAMTSMASRECNISRYRHGCDPPEQNAKVATLSACKGRRALTRFLNQLIQLQRILLASVFRFHSKNRESKNGELRGLGFFEQPDASFLRVGSQVRILTVPLCSENP